MTSVLPTRLDDGPLAIATQELARRYDRPFAPGTAPAPQGIDSFAGGAWTPPHAKRPRLSRQR